MNQVRSHLLALHPDNYHNLEVIQRSIMCIVFEDESPQDETEVSVWFCNACMQIFYIKLE